MTSEATFLASFSICEFFEFLPLGDIFNVSQGTLPAPFQGLFWLFIFSSSREYDAIVLSAGLSYNY